MSRVAITGDALFGGALRLAQPATGHRAGTDAVLLAAATPPDARVIADLGASTGAVGLRAAQMNPDARVTLIEREAAMAQLARDNILANGLDARVSVAEADVMRLGKADAFRETFDCVLTNPPFFEAGTGRVSPDRQRAAAHMLEGSLEDWVRNAAAILAPGGCLVMIHRADALDAVLAAFGRRLGGARLVFVHPRQDAEAIRLVVAGRKGSRAPLAVMPPLVLNGEGGGFLPFAAALHSGAARLALDPPGRGARTRRGPI